MKNSFSLPNGAELSNVTIVYAESPLNCSVGSLTGKTVGEDIGSLLLGENTAYDFDRQTALRLRDLLKKICNAELPLICASAREGVGGAIVIATDPLQYSPRAYEISERDGDLVICGGSYGATWHAIDAIEEALCAGRGIAMGKGSYPIRCVACMGDSITRGSQALPDGNGFGSPDGLAASFGGKATSHYFEQYLSYPANLARTLWKDYAVFNYGQGNSTMRRFESCVQFYYHDTAKFASALEASSREGHAFDDVFIMLGTNDSGREGGAKEWGDEQKADFVNEAERLLKAVLQSSPNARFVLMNVPHRCNCHKPSESDSVVRATQRETVQILAEKGYPITHYDMAAYTTAHMGNGSGTTLEEELAIHADYYNIRTDTGKPDTTHPNYRGYHSISLAVQSILEGK